MHAVGDGDTGPIREGHTHAIFVAFNVELPSGPEEGPSASSACSRGHAETWSDDSTRRTLPTRVAFNEVREEYPACARARWHGVGHGGHGGHPSAPGSRQRLSARPVRHIHDC